MNSDTKFEMTVCSSLAVRIEALKFSNILLCIHKVKPVRFLFQLFEATCRARWERRRFRDEITDAFVSAQE